MAQATTTVEFVPIRHPRATRSAAASPISACLLLMIAAGLISAAVDGARLARFHLETSSLPEFEALAQEPPLHWHRIFLTVTVALAAVPLWLALRFDRRQRTRGVGRFVLVLAIASLCPSVGWADVIEERVASNNDDAEEDNGGAVQRNNAKLEMGVKEWVGFRFHDPGIPPGATITAAYVTMRAADNNSESTSLTIFGQAHDDPPGFSDNNNDLSGRTRTTASVAWSNVPSWTLGQTYQTPSITTIIQELANRAGWATNSDVVILIRSENVNGKRLVDSYDATSTNAALLHVEYTLSTPSTTPTSDRLYVERFATRTAGSANTWSTVDLSVSPYNVPANKVVEIAIANFDSSNEQWGGVRAVGSSLDRRLQLHEAESGGIDAVVMHVQADASSQIQVYAGSTSLISFYVLGYWTTGTYTEKMQSFTVSSSATWQDVNLGTYGVGANQVAEVVMTHTDIDDETQTGVRSKGSSLTRTATLHEAQDGGVDAATMFVKASKSSDAVIQAYAGSSSVVTFYLIGYWKRPPGKFTETYTDLGVPTSTNTWQDKSLSSASVPAKAVASIILANTESGAENILGVRENGSTNSRLLELHQAKDGGGDYARVHVTADSTSTIEWYSEKTDTTKVDIYLTGYWEPAEHVLMVVADEQTPSTAALDRLTLLEGWGFIASLIDDGDPQSDYDAALPYYDLVYVPLEVNAAVGSKVSGASLGIVSEHASLVDDFGFSASSAATTGTSLFIADATHYITSTFSAGSLTILNSSQAVTTLSGMQSSHLEVPGEWGTAAALVTLEAGAHKYSGGSTMGRRVQLPWGGSGFDINALNSDGKTILQRSLQWASALKGYWKFDETTGTSASDSSGHQNHATLSSGTTFDANAMTPAKINGGLTFNGSSGYVSAAAAPSLEITNAITLSGWIKPTSLASAYLFDKDNSSSYYLETNANGSFTIGNATSGWQATSNASAIVAGTWQHIAATYNSATGTAVLYLDGVAVKTQTGLSGTIGISAAGLAIGSNNAGNADRFSGALDDLRIYNYALGQSEITALKRAGGIIGVRIIKWLEIQ